MLLLLVAPGLILVGCGGGSGGGDGLIGGGGIGGTGITSGSVTGFGSVFVNGIEFETSGSSFDVNDDATATESDLGIGMIVTVIGTVNDDGISGTAESIKYDFEVKGPIAAEPVENLVLARKTFTVMGVTVVADSATTVFVNTDYDSLARDDVVEVSGFFNETGALIATRLEKEGVLSAETRVGTRGIVSSFDGIDTFTLGTLTVRFDGATVFEDLPGTVANGQFVEAKGTLTTSTTMLATRIELEDEGFGDEVDKISIEGIVTDFNGLDDFRVSGQRVDASGETEFEPADLASKIADGIVVEVEGAIVGGVLEAEEVELRNGEIEIDGIVTGKNLSADTVTLEVLVGQPLTVITDTRTQFVDERDGMDDCTLTSIMTDDELAIIARIDTSGDLVANRITCDDLEDHYELRGPVDVPPTNGDSSSGSLTILGITIVTDDQTEFEDGSENELTGNEFFDQVSDGDLVEFEDKVPVDGIADQVVFEN